MLRFLLPVLALCALTNAAAQPARVPGTHGIIALPGNVADRQQAAGQGRQFTLTHLANNGRFRLRPSEGAPILHFGRRTDEKVTKAVIRVRYTYSPALIPTQSHVKLLLNDGVIGVLPVTAAHAGQEVLHTIAIDPGQIGTMNKLAFAFVGHYAHECQDLLHASTWLDLLEGTVVELNAEPIERMPDLANLPRPFFDENDLSRLELPFILDPSAPRPVLHAAGVAASWFGMLADRRQSRFPVLVDALPARHGIVFATNVHRPRFLDHLGPFDGPAVSVMRHPKHRFAHLLVLSGRDGADLQAAAMALVSAGPALTGAHMKVTQADLPAPRKAYDAPRWVRTDGPTELGKLVAHPGHLQMFGHSPAPLQLDLRIPPDLFVWQSRGVPVVVKYRYTLPPKAGGSSLKMYLNGDLVGSIGLKAGGAGSDAVRLIVPVVKPDPEVEERSRLLKTPSFELGYANDLQLAFSFDHPVLEGCQHNGTQAVQAVIDGKTQIDFSGHRHYAEMPHLGYFATMGFPFTRFADLGTTAILLPKVPEAKDVEVMLAILARMSASTGYPATRFSLPDSPDPAALLGRDLLVIGTAAKQQVLLSWSGHLPAMIDRAGHVPPDATFRDTAPLTRPNLLGRGLSAAPLLRGDAPFGALISFQSPVSKANTVVAVTGATADDMGSVLDTLDNDKQARRMFGGLVSIHEGMVRSHYGERSYGTGSLPWLTAVWYRMANHPVLLALGAFLTVIAAAAGLWRILTTQAQSRLR